MQNKTPIRIAIVLVALNLAACDYMPSWMGGRTDHKPPLPGERLEVLPQHSAIEADKMLASVPVTLPAPQVNEAWPQHTGVFTPTTSNLSLSGQKDVTDSTRIGESEKFEHMLVPSPVVAGGTVFAMDAAGFISAHEAGNIENIRWQSVGVSEEDEPAIMGGGLAFDSGKLYAVSGRGLVVAIDSATGTPIWRKSTHIPFRSAPVVAGDKLYAVSVDSQVYTFSASTGDIIWSQRGIRETAGILHSVSPVVASGTVIVPFPSGEIYALSAEDGRELWSDSLAIPSRDWAASMLAGIGGDPVVDGNVVFAVSSSGVFSVFNLYNGQKLWVYPASSLNTPWVTGDYVYLLTDENILVCFVKYSGGVRWATQLASYDDEKPIIWNGPVMADGNLLITGSHGQITVVSATDGNILGQREIEEEIYTPPVIAGGTLYLVSRDATLYSLK